MAIGSGRRPGLFMVTAAEAKAVWDGNAGGGSRMEFNSQATTAGGCRCEGLRYLLQASQSKTCFLFTKGNMYLDFFHQCWTMRNQGYDGHIPIEFLPRFFSLPAKQKGEPPVMITEQHSMLRTIDQGA